MPIGYKDPGTLVAEIKMTRDNHKGAFLVVEGTSDVRFWSPLINRDCELVSGEGKQNVVSGIVRLDSLDFKGVLGVVDGDYDFLNGVILGSVNIVATDVHDLECLLCQSSALDRVLAELGCLKKIQRFEHQVGVDVRTSLLNRAEIFGRIRWASQKFNLSIDTRVIRVPRFVDYQSWTVDDDKLMHAIERETSCEINLSTSLASLPSVDPWYVVHGADLIELLRIGLKHVLGDIPNSIGTREIARMLRVAISIEELKTTDFGDSIRIWETTNHPFKVYSV